MFTKLLNKTNSGKDFTLTTGNTDSNVSNALLVQTVSFDRLDLYVGS